MHIAAQAMKENLLFLLNVVKFILYDFIMGQNVTNDTDQK